jgi:PAS domain S-box-containing protein
VHKLNYADHAAESPVISLSAQQALRSTDDLLDVLPAGVCVVDTEGVLIRYNKSAAKLWGCEPEAGVSLFDAAKTFLPNGRVQSPDEDPIARVLKSGEPVHDHESLIERPDGTRIVLLSNIEPLLDASGSLVGAVSCFQDITARKAVEDYFHDHDRQAREILDAVPAAIYATDAEGRITYYNKATLSFAGREPVIGEDSWCVTHRLYAEDGTPLPHDRCPMAIALRENREVRGVNAVAERPDGTRIPFEPYPTPLHDKEGRLTGAVNMLIDLTDRKHTESRLAAIVASSDDAIVSKTLDGIVTSWNAGATRIFGYEASEMIGQPILRIIPENLHSEESDILARLRRGERIDHYETIRIRKDGKPVNISLTVSPLYNASGRVIGASKIARDITERVQAEERQKALLDELNHRVKNTLATVQALAAQTIRGEGLSPDILEVFNARLLALSKAHDQLSREGWQHADLRSVITGVFAPYGSSRVSLEGENVLIAPKAALTLAMVLHELATNAAKYGALSAPSGKLDLKWHATNGTGSRLLCLDWQESNGPPVVEPKRRGFGTRFLDRAISSEMEGRSVLQFAPAGVRCHMEIPLSPPP